MGSSNQKSKIKCHIRKEWVVEQPEELVRQQLISDMVNRLGYPRELIAVEMGLKEMPHLRHHDPQSIPDRRFDIIVFGKGIHPEHELYPLLLIECKAHALTKQAEHQVIGYNHYVHAYYICLANGEEVRCGWYDNEKETYQFVNYLPEASVIL